MKSFKMYEPREDSYLLEKHVKKLAFGKVLDIGTGSGIQAEAALKKAKSALASDTDKTILTKLNNKKFKVIYSDLFSNIKGKFDTIIFNPPYLPDSKYDNDKSLGGGKKGYEVLIKFLNQVSNYLTKKGIALIVFSSITNKKIIDETINNNLLNYELLEKKRIFFEKLYVYKIVKTKLLKEFENKNIKDIKLFAKGHRGIIFKAKYKNKDVAIKIKRPESKAIGRICNEIKFLKILNKYKIGPKLVFSTKDYFVYEFVHGKFILDYFENISKKDMTKILKEVLKQMYIMDKLKINKEEMHHPVKHVVINKNKPHLLDFERCYKTEKPHNVTQFLQFIISIRKRFKLDIERKSLIRLSRQYKSDYSKETLNKITKLIN